MKTKLAIVKQKPISRRVADLLERERDGLIRLDLGGGENPQQGCVNMDRRDLPTVDVVHDWDDIPWPLPDASVSLLMASHVVEHVNPANNGFLKFMDECWRVLKYDAQMMISTPYAGSPGYWADPTHINGCTHHTWDYFDPLKPSRVYYIYRPKPWRVEKCYWAIEGNMEVLLQKRRLDASYQ
jgi:SAM-dependent methyltransferase